MAKVYFDTGALIKLYICESGSVFVQNHANEAASIPLNPLQETELRNAIHAAIGRKTITLDAGKLALEAVNTDIRDGVLAIEVLDWKLVWQRSAHLAHLHTQKLLCRTLDILHVAAAESCCADLLLTGDKRQFQLGKAVGLPTLLVPDTI